MIEASFILLNDYFISDFWLGIQSLIQFISLLSQDMHLIVSLKHLYSVVKSLLHRKELLENFWNFFFGVSLTPESRSDLSHACIFRSSFFLFLFVRGGLSCIISPDVKISSLF